VTGRWAERAAALARRLGNLPLIKDAFIGGKVSWSMVDVLARRATPESERELLEWASGQTVRAVIAAFKAQDAALAEARLEAKVDAEDAVTAETGRRSTAELVAQPPTTLTLTMDRREFLLLEATRLLAQTMNGSESTEQWMDGLLAEGQETMQRALGRERAHLFEIDAVAQASRIARRDAARERTERCEEAAEESLPVSRPETGPEWDPKALPDDPEGLDVWLREVCAELSLRAPVQFVPASYPNATITSGFCLPGQIDPVPGVRRHALGFEPAAPMLVA
jgi:hypothetical protein